MRRSDKKSVDSSVSTTYLVPMPYSKKLPLGRGMHCTEKAYFLLTEQSLAQLSAFLRVFLLMLLRFIDGTA